MLWPCHLMASYSMSANPRWVNSHYSLWWKGSELICNSKVPEYLAEKDFARSESIRMFSWVPQSAPDNMSAQDTSTSNLAYEVELVMSLSETCNADHWRPSANVHCQFSTLWHQLFWTFFVLPCMGCAALYQGTTGVHWSSNNILLGVGTCIITALFTVAYRASTRSSK